jgi:hypothetical protein
VVKATQAGGDDVVGRHAGQHAQVHALALVELGGHHARAHHLHPDAGALADP